MVYLPVRLRITSDCRTSRRSPQHAGHAKRAQPARMQPAGMEAVGKGNAATIYSARDDAIASFR